MSEAYQKDFYEIQEGIPRKFHVWALLNKRVSEAAKKEMRKNAPK